jgi:hypothetical protein
MVALIPYLGTVSVCLAVLAFLLSVGFKRNEGLHVHLNRAAAGGAVPSALVLIYAGIEPAVLSKVSGLNVYITFGGLALLYVSAKVAFEKSN